MSASTSPHAWKMAAVCMLVTGLGGFSTALAEPDKSASFAESPSGENAAETDLMTTHRSGGRDKEGVVTAAILVITGVAFIGLLLVCWTIFWGSRLRRLARRPLPEQSPIDELWYLRPKKNRPGDSTGEASSFDSSESPPDSLESS